MGERLKLEIFWDTNDSKPIDLKEAKSVLQVLKSIKGVNRDSRVYLLVDNIAILSGLYSYPFFGHLSIYAVSY